NLLVLLTQTERLDYIRVALVRGTFQIIEQAAAASHQHEKTAARGVILYVALQMLGKLVDARRKNRDLHIGAASVLRVQAQRIKGIGLRHRFSYLNFVGRGVWRAFPSWQVVVSPCSQWVPAYVPHPFMSPKKAIPAIIALAVLGAAGWFGWKREAPPWRPKSTANTVPNAALAALRGPNVFPSPNARLYLEKAHPAYIPAGTDAGRLAQACQDP